MTNYADLEIGLHRREAGQYTVEFRFSQPDSEVDHIPGLGRPAAALFDLPGLQELEYEPEEYGAQLTRSLFADELARDNFSRSRDVAQSLEAVLRVRLLIGSSAPELHDLHWETLRDPESGSPLCTDRNVLFSRFLGSVDWRPVRLRPRGQLRALVAVANPTDLPPGLAPLDTAAELARARAGLADIPIQALAGETGETRATLANLVGCLADGQVDLLYLVCHGELVKREPYLYLEEAGGGLDRTAGSELVQSLKELQQRPRLVVLASCESAGTAEGGALAALGPRLAEAGIPAVIAMQGKITAATVAGLMPVFFRELQKHGQIDMALAVARQAVSERPDAWMPALFMRLRSGRIWYTPGFGRDPKGFEKWPALVRTIDRGRCTPIIGPGLYEPLLGSLREIAQRWAERFRYPMAPHERESLPQVAQYLSINQDRGFPYDELETYLQEEIQRRFGAALPAELQRPGAPLDELITASAAQRRAQGAWDAYEGLARLPLPIFVTTNANNLLSAALQEAGKDPQVVICPWNDDITTIETVFDRERDYSPSPERPLVYHLFGRLDEPDSIVLTEDDYFRYLIGIAKNIDLVPRPVQRALTDTALLFLGFQVDDWDFRVLFRSITLALGGGRNDRYANIAAQIEPEEGRILEPERARRYLEQYFARGAEISIYWGSAEDFMQDLLRHWQKT